MTNSNKLVDVLIDDLLRDAEVSGYIDGPIDFEKIKCEGRKTIRDKTLICNKARATHRNAQDLFVPDNRPSDESIVYDQHGLSS